MSRIGRKPVEIPSGVKVTVNNRKVHIEGPKGKLDLSVHPRMKLELSEKEITVSRPTDIRTDRSLHGLTRSLIQNMIIGVCKGYQKELEIVGVGFKAAVKGNMLTMSLGYSHQIEYEFPKDITVVCPNQTRVAVSGCDKKMVGQVAADIRRFHKPEPYKGKGVMYVGEQIRRKQGKTVG